MTYAIDSYRHDASTVLLHCSDRSMTHTMSYLCLNWADDDQSHQSILLQFPLKCYITFQEPLTNYFMNVMKKLYSLDLQADKKFLQLPKLYMLKTSDKEIVVLENFSQAFKSFQNFSLIFFEHWRLIETFNSNIIVIYSQVSCSERV